MKIRMFLSIGLVGCKKEEDIELEDFNLSEDEWLSMSMEEKENYMEQVMEDFFYNHIDAWWEEIS